MMKLNKFWFGVLFTVALVVMCSSFHYATLERGTDFVGGEAFTIALPFLMIAWREWTVGQNRKKALRKLRRREQNRRLLQDIAHAGYVAGKRTESRRQA